MICKNCKSSELTKVLKLEQLGGFYKTKKYNLKNISDLFKCKKCSLVQLNNNFTSENLFGKEYGYETSVSNLMIEHLKEKNLGLLNIKRY